MNTDKTLNETFYNNYKSEYPVWYYKELEEELSEWTDEDLELCVSKISEKLKRSDEYE